MVGDVEEVVDEVWLPDISDRLHGPGPWVESNHTLEGMRLRWSVIVIVGVPRKRSHTGNVLSVRTISKDSSVGMAVILVSESVSESLELMISRDLES